MKNKTAVQWLEEQLYKSGWDKLTNEEKINICATAKLMEMEQIENAYEEGKYVLPPNEYGEKYYKETYRSK